MYSYYIIILMQDMHVYIICAEHRSPRDSTCSEPGCLTIDGHASKVVKNHLLRVRLVDIYHEAQAAICSATTSG